VGRKRLVRKPAPERKIAWPRWTGFRGMTLRNWLELLVVPFALVVIGFLFSVQQDARQQRIENQRAEAERELAEQRAQDEALQAYLDQMSQLMLERDLRESEEGSDVSTLARARTLTGLGRLEPSRKEAVFQFLMEAGLVQREEGRQAVISLVGADLSGINLSLADLRGVDWGGIDLSGAILMGTDLRDANLSFADLSGATVSGRLGGADLTHTDLSGATLGGYLGNAKLYQADLTGAKLRDPDLSGANLFLVEGVTNEDLEQQAASLKGATMPNGQKYEEWLKS
jgi:uncharacterized protein YjbI with pentapeptide repeats